MGGGYQNKGNMRRMPKSASSQSIARAARLIRKRMARSPRAPLSTRGLTGAYRGLKELKFNDVAASAQALTTTWSVAVLNGITQGTDFNQRIGRHAIMKSILFNGVVYNSTTSNPLGVFCRFVILLDNQVNSGAIAGGTDIFATNDPLSPMNLNNRDRFQVLMDIRKQIGPFTITAGALTGGAPQNQFWSKYRKCFYDTVYSGTSNTIGSISSGAIILAIICDTMTSAALNFYTRVRYIDP